MPRSQPRRRRAAYWWSEDIAVLRSASDRARRAYTRARRQDGDATRAKEDYLAARVVLKKTIKKAKREAWEQLVSSLDDDPWGRPYKRTMEKIRLWTPPQTGTLDPQALDRLLDALFPRAEGGPPVIPSPEMGEGDWDEGLEITTEELAKAWRKLGGKGKSPGPDAIPGRTWALALAEGDLSAATCRVQT
ncbi:uncharacterized protein LOC112590166 [Harpegnathos saltator]|uniref:uncharacterized protein LOC112590166 n=1 Tax=Harpegnathos saltator TaxID=610380 RepID=UPI000DBEDC09|nr:uncharacterized protein LOC112590166 [Harpegnathos saltator]